MSELQWRDVVRGASRRIMQRMQCWDVLRNGRDDMSELQCWDVLWRNGVDMSELQCWDVLWARTRGELSWMLGWDVLE